jgi:hypothetical protein
MIFQPPNLRCIQAAGALLLGILLLPCSATPQSSLSADDCRPLVFPAGSQGDVVSKAAEFLTKVETVQQHPYWPGGISGVTLGIGWDLGYHSRADFRREWMALGATKLEQLEAAVGKTGAAAQGLITQLKSITVPAAISRQVLLDSLHGYYYPFVTDHFPGLKQLPAEAQVVLISLVFNRGVSMGHEPDWRLAKEVDKRWEFRELRGDIKGGDMFAIYAHLGTMKRLWEKSGPRGLRIRRRDEQALIRPYVDQQLRWEEKCPH